MTRLIDAHVHVYPPEINRDPLGWARVHREEAWAGLTTRVRRSGRPVQSFPSVDDLLREMDRAQIERAILLGWYWENAASCRLQNDFYAQCVHAHPLRLSAMATIQPRLGAEAVTAEMVRARAAGLRGLGELSPHAQGYAMDHAGFRRALTLAAEWHWPVNLHVTDPNTREYPGRVETPLDDFLALARAHPSVNFVLAHWGGLLPLRDSRAGELTNVFLDTAASPLTYDASVWERVLAHFPAERVLFGSDFPLNLFPNLDAEPSIVRFADEARASGAPTAVLADNVRRLLRLPAG